MKQLSNTPRLVEVLIHVIGWGIIFGFPFLMMIRSGMSITFTDYLRHGSIMPFTFILIFYVNYCLLVPRYLFNGRIWQYLVLNLLLMVAVSLGTHWWYQLLYSPMTMEGSLPRHRYIGPPIWVVLMRDLMTMITIAGLSAAIKMSGRWVQMESARREAEKDRTEAELKNLRNQLNPHFLLNTLNNIYALIAFDADKAQAAVQELSRLLRHVLYENQQPFVTLAKEMDFIRNYIELMRIRLATHVSVETDIDIAPDSRTLIAPLIFISLIENAFKHGISPTESSFIHIHFSETSQEIRCIIINSYHPKNDTDKSGSGIGLEQVSKRLELTYPENYTWSKGVSDDGKEYRSELIIKHTVSN